MNLRFVKRIARIFCSLAVLVAPIASEYCRGLFYQPEEPEMMSEFLSDKR